MFELRESAFAVTCVGVDDRPRLVAVGVARDGVAAVGHGERVDLFLGYAVAAVGRSADTRGRGDHAPLVAAGDARVDLLRSAAGPGTYRREERVEAGVGVRAVGADQRVEVQVHNVFGGLGCQLPFLFVVLGREQVVTVFVDDTLVEFVAVEELAGRVEQQAGACCQGGAFRGTAVVDVGPAVGQPLGGFPKLVRDVVDALVPGVALALVESALREVHRIVADEEDGTVDGQHHGVEMRAQEAGLVVVVALVDIVQFLRRALVDVLHEVVGFADALIGRVVGVVAVDGQRWVPRVVVDLGVGPVQIGERGLVRAGLPGDVVVARHAGGSFVIRLVGVDVGQVLERGLLFFEDVVRSQRLVGLAVEV